MELTAQIVALYLGQKCQTPHGVAEIIGVDSDWVYVFDDERLEYLIDGVKPILRRTESLTEMEARELYEIRHGKATHKWDDEYRARWEFWKADDEWVLSEQMLCTGVPAVWLKLLSWGFDLFGLIDSGAAIDAATLEKTVEV